MRDLITTLKKKNAGGELIVEHSPKILAREEKATTTTTYTFAYNLTVHGEKMVWSETSDNFQYR